MVYFWTWFKSALLVLSFIFIMIAYFDGVHIKNAVAAERME
jgi:hypothetical protein